MDRSLRPVHSLGGTVIPGFEVAEIPEAKGHVTGGNEGLSIIMMLTPQLKELISVYIEKLRSEIKRNLAEAEKHNRTAVTLEQKTALLQEEAGHIESQRRELDADSKLRFEVADATKAEALDTRRQQLCADKAEALARMAEAKARQARAEAQEGIQRSRRPASQQHHPRQERREPPKMEAKAEPEKKQKEPEPAIPTQAQA